MEELSDEMRMFAMFFCYNLVWTANTLLAVLQMMMMVMMIMMILIYARGTSRPCHWIRDSESHKQNRKSAEPCVSACEHQRCRHRYKDASAKEKAQGIVRERRLLGYEVMPFCYVMRWSRS